MTTSVYHITTEGDCEGRTTKSLGYFSGDLETILLHLAKSSYYSLKVEEIVVKDTASTTLDPTGDTVHFSYQGSFPTPNSRVVASNFYRSKKLEARGYMQSIEDRRKKVLAELTDEQRYVLGLQE